jgi:hypothetical protein
MIAKTALHSTRMNFDKAAKWNATRDETIDIPQKSEEAELFVWKFRRR